MNREDAKKILALYRPGVTDGADPEMRAAIELARRDPELAAWFEQHCAVFTAIRGKLKSVPVPQGLRRQIIVGHIAETRILPLTSRLLLASAVAALVLLTAIVWIQLRLNPQDRFEGWRDLMARKVQRGYVMDMFSTNQTAIRAYFGSRGTPSNYILPSALASLPGEGGVVFPWNTHKITLLCLNGATKPGVKNDLYLFMANRADIPGAPEEGKPPQFKQVSNFMTMTWATCDRVFLLTASGGEDEAALRKYLE